MMGGLVGSYLRLQVLALIKVVNPSLVIPYANKYTRGRYHMTINNYLWSPVKFCNEYTSCGEVIPPYKQLRCSIIRAGHMT